MTPEELAAIRERATRDYSAHESGIYLSNELVADRHDLLAEVDRLNEALEAARANALRWEAERNGAWKQGYDQARGDQMTEGEADVLRQWSGM